MLILNFYSAGKGGIGLYEEVSRLTWEHTGGDTNGELPDPGSTTSQTWMTSKTIIGLELGFEMTFGPGPGYRFTATMKDSGKLKAENGQFSVLNGAGAVHRGPYQIIDDDTISMGVQPFQQTWHRLE